jgi:multidrug efflux pump subunit AcrA (membrane-fusion protein)
MPLWRTLAKQHWLFTLTGMSKLILAVSLVVGLIAAAVLVPADFRVQSTGQLQPSLRREVFAGIDGNVKEVLVSHGQLVEAGQILLRLENTDLEVQIENIRGQQATTLEEITSIQRGLLDQARLSLVEQHRLNGQLRQLAQTQIALNRELALLLQKRERLDVRSPITGMIVTWDAQQELTQRPVTGGERLLTVVDPASRWELELEVPEKRLGHVKQARHRLQPDLHVTFSLGTHPGRTFDGRIINLRETAEPEGPRKGSVVARVQVESTDLPPLHPGATATGKIDCGERSVGYVYLHDVWETVQRQVWIWF